LGAFFAVEPQKTGLSACIFFACGKKGYRFYPLRGRPGKRVVTGKYSVLPQSGGVVLNSPSRAIVFYHFYV
jgi:hypothetical protein